MCSRAVPRPFTLRSQPQPQPQAYELDLCSPPLSMRSLWALLSVFDRWQPKPIRRPAAGPGASCTVVVDASAVADSYWIMTRGQCPELYRLEIRSGALWLTAHQRPGGPVIQVISVGYPVVPGG